jgi:hypothetical protein
MPYSPRDTRMVKSYAPIVNGLTELFEIDKPDRTPVLIFCEETRKYYHSDEFYVKKYRQHKDPKKLYLNDFRHITKEIWDQRVRNQRKGLGWKSDYELENPPATIENFFHEVTYNE